LAVLRGRGNVKPTHTKKMRNDASEAAKLVLAVYPAIQPSIHPSINQSINQGVSGPKPVNINGLFLNGKRTFRVHFGNRHAIYAKC